MKLENKFFNSFFYPFLVGVILSMIAVTFFLTKFTNKFIDKRTGKNIVDLEKKTASTNINSINLLLSTTLLKIHASLNEHILFYLKLANRVEDISNYEINKFLVCFLDLTDEFLEENIDDLKYMALWQKDSKIKINDLGKNSPERLQLIIYSNIIQNIYSSMASTKSIADIYYFLFMNTEIIIDFPIEYYYKNDFLKTIKNFTNNPTWCCDMNGNIYSEYRFKCREYFTNILKSNSMYYDYNCDNLKENRTIFITNSYKQFGIEDSWYIFTMCIQFFDPISKGPAYACSDVSQDDLIYSFDNFNSKLVGYFLITSVGFNKAFYYPQNIDDSKSPTENIFRWDKKFYLEEKTYFKNHIQKLMTSNYNNIINDDESSSSDLIFDEIKINGINTSEQYFYINKEKFYFSIFPVVLSNLKGIKEHVLSIVYIYNNQLYYNRLKSYQTNSYVKILLELLLFTVFGWCLLYLVILTFNTLAKYIVVPIKNVNYMLKGIHIGGENRLDYLNFLKKKQDESLEKLEKMNYNLENKKMKNDMPDETDNHLLNENNNEDNNINKINDKKDDISLTKNNNDFSEQDNIVKNMEYNGEIINPNIDYNKKYDEESEYIEKENNFYDFDEELLQYRPLEIDRLVKVLLNLKGALLLTSTDHEVGQIIDYSYSEEIFRNFKNKEGSFICQSNIGNLQSQLLKFDKAIYHLALSLEDDKLKRFLSRTLSDELDESDTLLHKIYSSYNKDKDKEKTNILAEKQQNSTKDSFSQKIIGILINSRYCKLINVYFKFFSFIQKSNIDMLSGQFMNKYYHTINYYHKIIIQYIYLSYVKNDLVKIGESILDYIEFLIEFKFKTSSENKYLLNINNRELPEYKDKQMFKKKIFDKIINWFNLFDKYASHVRDNSSLGDDKSLIDDYSQSLNSDTGELNSGSQSVFLFRVNIQRSDFLKGKFALECKNINDALFFFIRAAKKNSIVLDGLIKKKSLEYILKISSKILKKLRFYSLIHLPIKQKLIEYQKNRNRLGKKNNYKSKNNNNEEGKDSEEKNENTFKDEMEDIINEISIDINECNAKQSKDIVILIDFNLYLNDSNNKNNNKIDSFIDQTKTILNNYLSNNDRLGVFIYTKQYQIICPLMCKKQIDINNFSKDLNNYKKKFFKESIDTEENDIIENYIENQKKEFQSDGDDFSEPRSQIDSDEDDKRERDILIFSGLLKSINYIINYIKTKEAVENENYIILFTDVFNYYKVTEEGIGKIFININSDKEINFILAGKNTKRNLNNEKEDSFHDDDEKKLDEIIADKFGDKSEVIFFENMKKIKNILSNNNVIKDEILFPNEIYK